MTTGTGAGRGPGAAAAAGLPEEDSSSQTLDGVVRAVRAEQVTIGVAIPVPSPHAELLQRWRTDFGDPLGAVVPAHVTIVPPTAVEAEALDDVHEHLRASAAAVEPFAIRLSGTGTFRPVSPVVFVQVAAGGRECAALEQRVRSGVLGSQRRFPYHPHVTVAQEVDDAALDRARSTLAGYEVAFPVASVELYLHGSDGVWRPCAEFPLGRA